MVSHSQLTSGVDRTLTDLFNLQQVWKNMKQLVRMFIQNCSCCQKLSAEDPKTNASHFASSNYAIFDTLNVEYVGPFPDKGRILVIIDTLHAGQNCSGVQMQMQNQQLIVCLRILVDLVHQIS